MMEVLADLQNHNRTTFKLAHDRRWCIFSFSWSGLESDKKNLFAAVASHCRQNAPSIKWLSRCANFFMSVSCCLYGPAPYPHAKLLSAQWARKWSSQTRSSCPADKTLKKRNMQVKFLKDGVLKGKVHVLNRLRPKWRGCNSVYE